MTEVNLDAVQSMLETIDERKIGRHETSDDRGPILIVDTALILSRDYLYETAVSVLGCDREWIIVEGYDSLENAQTGHAKWIEKMAKEMPPELYDIFSKGIVLLAQQDLRMECEGTFDIDEEGN